MAHRRSVMRSDGVTASWVATQREDGKYDVCAWIQGKDHATFPSAPGLDSIYDAYDVIDSDRENFLAYKWPVTLEY